MKRFLLSLTLVACGGSTSGGNTPCDDAGTCPTGLVCQQGFCLVPSSGGSGGIGQGGSGAVSGGSGGLPSGGSGGLATGGGGVPPTGGGGSGATGGGGTGGGPVSCDPPNPPANPGSCTAEPSNICQSCIEQNCCTEYANCIATNPDDACGWGGPDGSGESFCIQMCLFDAQANGGVADDATIAACAGSCITPGCATVTPQTNDLITCLKDLCFSECLQQ